MTNSITSFFTSNVSEEFIHQWSSFIGLPADDGLSRATAQIISTNFDLNTELKSSINTLAEVGGQWQIINSSTITALTTTVETVGVVSTRHQEISQKLTELTRLYELSQDSNQQLQETLKQSQQLYQESLTRNQELQHSYEVTQRQSQKLLTSLETLTNGLLLKEDLSTSQNQDFQTLMERSNSTLKQLAGSCQNLEAKLDGQSNQNPALERKIFQRFDSLKSQVENLIGQSIVPASRSLRTLEDSLDLFKVSHRETVVTLYNYKTAILSLIFVSFVLLGLFFSAHVSNVRAASVNDSVSAFGGPYYHRVALNIMSSDYRKENLNRIDRCRERNKKIKSDILECYLKIEGASL
jgi:hypothetical protein